MSNELPNAEESVSYDPKTNTYRATFDNETVDPSIAVVEVIASICEREPTELDPLYEVIDLDALDQLLLTPASGNHAGDRTVEFTFQDYSVTILSYGIIKVRPMATEE